MKHNNSISHRLIFLLLFVVVCSGCERKSERAAVPANSVSMEVMHIRWGYVNTTGGIAVYCDGEFLGNDSEGVALALKRIDDAERLRRVEIHCPFSLENRGGPDALTARDLFDIRPEFRERINSIVTKRRITVERIYGDGSLFNGRIEGAE